MAVIPDTHNTGLTPTQIDTAFSNALTHTPSSSTPAMDGTGAAGTADTFARGDHVHPHDTTKQDTVLGSWTPDTSATHQTPAGTDTVLEALQKIDRNQRADETNILLDFKRNNINLSTVNGGVNSGGAGTIIVDTAVDMPAGEYVFCWKNSVSTGGVATVVNCYTSNNTRVVNENKVNSAVEERMIAVPQDCVKFNLYCTGINTITDFMIVPKSAFTTGMAYHNPTPSIAQLYQMILNL